MSGGDWDDDGDCAGALTRLTRKNWSRAKESVAASELPSGNRDGVHD